MAELLLHSMSEFASVILPALEAAGAKRIAEIGAEHGGMTRILSEYVTSSDGHLVTIDPSVSPDFVEWASNNPRVTHVAKPSLEAISNQENIDAWLIDGDHNWFTVYHELKAIAEHARRFDKPFLVFLHDVGWPCARRDQYYAPKRIPDQFLHAHSFEHGVNLDSQVALYKRGFRGEGAFAYALLGGGPRNGVLTAIEDFYAESNTQLFWAEIPGVFGLGVLFATDASWSPVLAGQLHFFHQNPLLKVLEENRLRNYLQVIELQDRAAQANTTVQGTVGLVAQRKDLSGKFCNAPFRKFETLIDGTVAPCCSIWTDLRLGNIDQQDFAQIWNSESAQEMRASILDGSFRHCKHDRCDLIVNDRLPDRDSVDDPLMRSVIENQTTVMEVGPEWLFLAHDVTCNLACPSCRSGILAADETQEARFNKIEEQVLRPMIRPEHPIVISVAGQGDPWSSPHYRSFLRYLAETENDVTLNLHSNGLLMTPARWEQYKGLSKYNPLLDVSIDACSPWTYEYVRYPGEWSKLEPNLRFFGQLRSNGTLREYHINATVQLDNFHELGDMADLIKSVGADTLRLYLVQMTGKHIEREFKRKNVANPDHPLHTVFLEALRDERLGLSHVHLYDVSTIRNRALKTRLPSDEFDTATDEETLLSAAQAALEGGDALRGLALATAARVRFPRSANSRMVEAAGLHALGFPWQASYRYREVLDVEPDYIDARVALATAHVEAGNAEEGERQLREILGKAEITNEVRAQITSYIEYFIEPKRERVARDGA